MVFGHQQLGHVASQYQARFGIVLCVAFVTLTLVISSFSQLFGGAGYSRGRGSFGLGGGRGGRTASGEKAIQLPEKYAGVWPACTAPVEEMENLRLSRPFLYSCRPIDPDPTRFEPSSLPIRDNRLLWRPSREFELESYGTMVAQTTSPHRGDILKLTTTVEGGPPFGSEVVFGLASDVQRIMVRAKAIAHWIAHTDALLVISLPKEEQGQKGDGLAQHLQSLGIKCKIVTYDMSAVKRYLHLIRDFSDVQRPYHQWFVWTDDDTFFISAQRLRAMLSKYDPNALMYIGNISEDWFQIKTASDLFAFGGGGVITSAALLKQLAPHVDRCNENWGDPYGDLQLGHCVFAHTPARLTFEYTLRQGDLKGNVNGLFESGRYQTSMHHWNSWWFNVDMPQYVVVSAKTTGGSVGERFQFTSPNSARRTAVLTNGYSLVEYTGKVWPTIDFTKMEQTWENRSADNQYHYDFNFGPLRSPLDEGRERFTYLMERAWQDEKHPAKPVHQLYVRRGAVGDKDEVVHLMWV